MLRLSINEKSLLRKALDTTNLDRDIVINERDNSEDFAAFQPYIPDGQTTLSNGQRVNLVEGQTDEGLKNITITPLANTDPNTGLPTEEVTTTIPEQKPDEEILVDTIKKLVESKDKSQKKAFELEGGTLEEGFTDNDYSHMFDNYITEYGGDFVANVYNNFFGGETATPENIKELMVSNDDISIFLDHLEFMKEDQEQESNEIHLTMG